MSFPKCLSPVFIFQRVACWTPKHFKLVLMIVTHENRYDGFKGNSSFQVTYMRFQIDIFSWAETYPLLGGYQVHFVFWFPVFSYVNTRIVFSHSKENISSDVVVEIFIFVLGCVDQVAVASARCLYTM